MNTADWDRFYDLQVLSVEPPGLAAPGHASSEFQGGKGSFRSESPLISRKSTRSVIVSGSTGVYRSESEFAKI
jgi:hypothetical protein